MTDSTQIGRWIMIAGLGLTVIGALVWGLGRLGFPIGRLPGDIRIHRDGVHVYVPVTSAILVSIAASILLNLFLRFTKR